MLNASLHKGEEKCIVAPGSGGLSNGFGRGTLSIRAFRSSLQRPRLRVGLCQSLYHLARVGQLGRSLALSIFIPQASSSYTHGLVAVVHQVVGTSSRHDGPLSRHCFCQKLSSAGTASYDKSCYAWQSFCHIMRSCIVGCRRPCTHKLRPSSVQCTVHGSRQ